MEIASEFRYKDPIIDENALTIILSQSRRSVIRNRIEQEVAPLGVEIAYAFQEISDIPGNVPVGRTKPWGTGHAVLACNLCSTANIISIGHRVYNLHEVLQGLELFRRSHE